MRWIAFLLVLALSGEARAETFLLIPEDNSKPVYPLALERAGITGDVRVRFTAHADGSVSKVSILHSDHPDFADATRVAVEQWRFKPWVVDDDKPGEQEVVSPMIFRYDTNLPIHINQWLNELRCRDFNEVMVNTPENSWIDAPAFYYTRAYLSNAFSSTMLSNERRLELIARMNKRVPMIVRQCSSSPTSRFARFLPEELRTLL